MFRFLARLLGLFILGSIVAGIVSAVAAARARERILAVDDPAADDVTLPTIFAAREFASEATSFRGGSILTWYGGAQVDLRKATLAPAGAHLDVRTIFGGTQILVPDAWRVELHGPGILGANTMVARPTPPADAPTLTIEAMSLFGGTQVTAREEDVWNMAGVGNPSWKPARTDGAEPSDGASAPAAEAAPVPSVVAPLEPAATEPVATVADEPAVEAATEPIAGGDGPAADTDVSAG